MRFERDKAIGFLDRAILVLIYIVVYFLPISTAIIETASILAIALYVFKKILQRSLLPDTYMNYAIFAYLAICFLSVFLSSNLIISAHTFSYKLLQNILFFFAVVETLNNQRRVRNVFYILFVSAALLGIDGIYQHFTHKDFIRCRKWWDIPRITASFYTPNDFGCYLAMVIPFVISAFAFFRRRFARASVLALFVLLFSCLMLTVSRGSWLVSLISILFMSLWLRYLAVFLVLVLIVGTAAFFLSGNTYLQARLKGMFELTDAGSMDRRLIWQGCLKMILSKPWMGIGLGTFMFNFRRFVDYPYGHGIPYAHNCYLQIAAETGVIGLASFLLILLVFFYYGIRFLKKGRRDVYWYTSLASVSAAIVFCGHMLFDTSLYNLNLGMFFWFDLALGAAVIIKGSQLLPADTAEGGLK
ncbi:MAG: O-antigen ligase family protein [Candidatus Omnitrophica bacterium]|nr:O-antigen ligase family protein [Candidatus Omnitrophota bacterium]